MKEIVTLDRELDLLQQQLEQVKAEKEILEIQMAIMLKEMNHFTYIVSHDLQAPLRMVTGFLELLEKKYGEKLDDTAKNYISYTIKGAVKMKNLIFDLLAYSRLNTIEQEYTEVDLNLIVEEVSSRFIAEIESTGAKITVGKMPVVLADKKQMELLFFQLFSNAIKFHESDVPEITISSQQIGERWKIGIRDNGIGIDQGFFEKIFVVFRRLHADDSKYAGTGIGLAICKKIIELHKGRIWVESIVKNGSTFYIELPVKA